MNILPSEVFAIDPGPEVSGFYSGPTRHGVMLNEDLLGVLPKMPGNVLAVEMLEPRGMPLGKESIETVLWTGRFVQEWRQWHKDWMPVSRMAVKLMLCGTTRAKDANVRQALIDIYGRPGTKKAPGGTYGVKSHVWAALAVWHYATQTIGLGD